MKALTLAYKKALLGSFLAFLALLIGLSAWQWRSGAPVSASLLDILPEGYADPVQHKAQQKMQAPLDRELLLLVEQGKEADPKALDWVKQQLVDSGLFSTVQSTVSINLEQLRQELLQDSAAFLPLADRQLLAEQPDIFVQQRIEQLFDPIQGFSLVRPEQDWLGITGRIQQHLQPESKVQVDLQGQLYAEQNGIRWVLVRASTRDSAFNGNLSLAVAAQVEAIAQQLNKQDIRLLAASGLLFAAAGQKQAAAEMQWIGGISTLGALLLIGLLFRSLRSLMAFIPAIIGMWAGVTCCVLLFGKIHVMTLVLGASLIGVTIDFPLHYLSKAWRAGQWDSWQILRATFPGLSLGVLTNAIGYVALAFTPFPALTQVAVFSVTGLLAAYFCTICLLPWLFAQHKMNLSPAPVACMQWLLDRRAQLISYVGNKTLLLALIVFTAGGLWKLNVHDDLREWISPQPALFKQAQAIAEITGHQPTSQFFLVRGPSEDQLFARLQVLSEQLEIAKQQSYISSYLSPSQLLAGKIGLPSLPEVANQLSVQQLQALQELGIDSELLNQELERLRHLPMRTSEAVLEDTIAEPWRDLWLGLEQDQYVAMVSLQGLTNVPAMAGLANATQGITWVDRPAELNLLFKQTQSKAIFLKLASSIVIFLLLVVALGWRGAFSTLAVSLCAAIIAAACFGWLGETLTLFSLFGLLLVTAIGVDYAIIMYEGVGDAAVSLLGTLLAAVTTWLSFGLLGVSSTPVVSSFGLAVTLGLLFCFMLSPWASRLHPDSA